MTVAYVDSDYVFPFHQESGLTTLEAGGFRSATLSGFANNPAQWVAGRSDFALSFDGTDDCVSVDGFSGITGANPRTCAAWIKLSGNGQFPVIAWGPNVTGNKWTVLIQGGQPRIEVTGGFLQASRTVNDGQWHHVACSFRNDGTPNVTDTRLYIDGTLETTFAGSAAQTVNTAATQVQIGRDVQNRFFNGVMDDARIYARELSASEVATLANEANSAIQAWHRRHFGVSPVDWNADDDHDGLSRLTEYAIGGQPHAPDGALLSKSWVNGKLRVTFPRRREGTHAIIYSVETSFDLLNWTATGAVEISRTARDEEFDFVTSEVNLPEGSPKAFVRLQTSTQ